LDLGHWILLYNSVFNPTLGIDAWILDFDTKTLTEGKCETSKLEYIGIFEGGGSKPWKYYSSEQRRETILEAKGG